jgi:hypothetical protein
MKYLSHYTKDKQTELFTSLGAFWAFGNYQLEAQAKPGVKYASLGAGLICPKDNVNELLKGLDTIALEGIKEDIKENGAEAIIEREYFNYESHITINTEDASNSLKQYQKYFSDLFTEDLINRVFNRCFEKAVELDLF